MYSGLGSSGSWVVQDDVLYGMVIAIIPMDRCALILPQRRMYTDIKDLLPDVTSILISSGVPSGVRRRKKPQKVFQEQVNFNTQRRNKTCASDRTRREKELCLPVIQEQEPEVSKQERETSLGIVMKSASETCRRRPAQIQYLLPLRLGAF